MSTEAKPRFTYKHYYRLADLVNRWIRETNVTADVVTPWIDMLCEMFEADNPRFSRRLFVLRCTRIEAPSE